MRLPRLSEGSGRWILLAAIVLPFAFLRIQSALASTEERLEAHFVRMLQALEERKPRRIVRGFSKRFEDADTGYGREEIRQWANSIVLGTRYRGSLVEPDGFEIIELSTEDVKPRTATVKVKCLLERRERETEFRPWWDLEFTASMVRDEGDWRIVRTQDVNHETRPRQ